MSPQPDLETVLVAPAPLQKPLLQRPKPATLPVASPGLAFTAQHQPALTLTPASHPRLPASRLGTFTSPHPCPRGPARAPRRHSWSARLPPFRELLCHLLDSNVAASHASTGRQGNLFREAFGMCLSLSVVSLQTAIFQNSGGCRKC